MANGSFEYGEGSLDLRRIFFGGRDRTLSFGGEVIGCDLQ